MKLLNWFSMSSSPSKSILVENSTQTIIKVHPHVFDNVDDFAYVTSDKKLQSVIAMKPSEDTNKFINLLRFTPYQDITEGSLRIIDLERKKKLHFRSIVEFQTQSDHASEFSMADDDGVGYICCDIIRKRLNQRKMTTFHDNEAQTDLKIHPHVLENVDVATVNEDKGTQTTIEAAKSKQRGCSRRVSTMD